MRILTILLIIQFCGAVTVEAHTKYIFIEQTGNRNVYFTPIYIGPNPDVVDKYGKHTRYFKVSEDAYSHIQNYILNYRENRVDTNKALSLDCYNCFKITIAENDKTVQYEIKTEEESNKFFGKLTRNLQETQGIIADTNGEQTLVEAMQDILLDICTPFLLQMK